jgi:hypothetical protein
MSYCAELASADVDTSCISYTVEVRQVYDRSMGRRNAQMFDLFVSLSTFVLCRDSTYTRHKTPMCPMHKLHQALVSKDMPWMLLPSMLRMHPETDICHLAK